MQVEIGPITVKCPKCRVPYPLVTVCSHLLIDHDLTLGEVRTALVLLSHRAVNRPAPDRLEFVVEDAGEPLPVVVEKNAGGDLYRVDDDLFALAAGA